MKNKLNLPPFYVGETVECVNPVEFLVKGEKYVIEQITKCSCGLCLVSLRGQHVKGAYMYSRCIECGALSEPNLFKAYRFRSLQQQSYPLMTFQKIVEKEKEEILINN